MRVAFLGLGLIGGSLARAVHEAGGSWTAAAWSPRGDGPARALEAGVIAAAAPSIEAAVDGADIVVLAAPPTECLALLDELGGRARPALAPGAVITDVASTKTAIVDRAAALGLRFIGGHPMAGRESVGFASADPALFAGRPWILVPPAAGDDAALDRVETMIGPTGARTVRMEAATHDALVAGVSHMPLILAVALVEAVAGTGPSPRGDWEQAGALAASGWASMTRLARGDATMGSGIAATNAAAIADRLHDVRAVIDEWLALLEAADGPDEVAIHARMAAAKARLGAGDP
jgi:prephenate dehydrogenase